MIISNECETLIVNDMISKEQINKFNTCYIDFLYLHGIGIPASDHFRVSILFFTIDINSKRNFKLILPISSQIEQI